MKTKLLLLTLLVACVAARTIVRLEWRRGRERRVQFFNVRRVRGLDQLREVIDFLSQPEAARALRVLTECAFERGLELLNTPWGLRVVELAGILVLRENHVLLDRTCRRPPNVVRLIRTRPTRQGSIKLTYRQTGGVNFSRRNSACRTHFNRCTSGAADANSCVQCLGGCLAAMRIAPTARLCPGETARALLTCNKRLHAIVFVCNRRKNCNLVFQK